MRNEHGGIVLTENVMDIYDIDKEKYIERLIEELPVLRAKIGLSQAELGDVVGLSRQTYSSIETKKRSMSWNTFMALMMFFSVNGFTSEYVTNSGLLTPELIDVLNIRKRG